MQTTRAARPVARRSGVRALLLSVLVLLIAVPLVRARAQSLPIVPCARGGALQGYWQVYNRPVFPARPGVTAGQSVTDMAVDPRTQGRLFVTNGKSVMYSTDHGCRWTFSFALEAAPRPRMPLSGVNSSIVSMVMSRGVPGRLMLAVHEQVSGETGRTHVVIGDGQSGSFALSDSGLPPAGRPLQLRASPRNNNLVYLAMSAVSTGSTLPGGLPGLPGQPKTSPGALYRSANNGASWVLATTTAARIDDVAPDRNDTDAVWVIVGGKLRHSTRSGAGLSAPAGLDQGTATFTAVESLAKKPGFPSVAAFSTRGPAVRYLDPAGRWRSAAGPTNVRSVASRGTDLVLSSAVGNAAAALHRATLPGFRFGTITPPATPLQGDLHLQSSGDTAPGYYGSGREKVIRYVGPPVDPNKAPPPPRGSLNGPNTAGSRFTPRNSDISMQVGERRAVDYTLDVPRSPTPLDLFILIDGSESMRPVLRGLQEGLFDVASDLVKFGIDVRIGLARNDGRQQKSTDGVGPTKTPVPDSGINDNPYYTRLRAIGPVNAELFRELDQFNLPTGGATEAHYESLYQSVTGEGLRLVADGIAPIWNVKPGQDARFRPAESTLRVILHATDEGADQDAELRDKYKRTLHTRNQAVAAMRQAGVLHVGLSQAVPQAEELLIDLSRATGTLAPPGGIDCGGDGTIDIPAGAAIVCGSNANLDVTLTTILKSLRDVRDLQIAASKSPVLESIDRTRFQIDLKKDARMRFRVMFSCVGVAPGTHEVNFGAVLRGYKVASAVANVTCGVTPGVPLPPPPPPPPPARGEAPQQPPANPAAQPPGPVLVPNVQPIPQAQTQVQPQTQVNPQGGIADQEQEQIQVATAINDWREDSVQEHAMSALAGAALMSMCAGAVFAHRRRAASAPAYVRASR